MTKHLVLCFLLGAALSGRAEGLVARWDFEDNKAGKTLNAATGAYDAEIRACEVVKTAGGNVLKMGDKSSFRSDNPRGKFASFTVSFWILPVDVRENQTGVSALGGGPGLGTFHFVMGKDGHVFSGIYAFSRFTPEKLKPGTMKIGVWQFVAFTFDNTDAKLYLNGAEIARMPMRMPDAWDGFSAEGSFLDDIRIYDTALLVAEIHAQWKKGQWRLKLNPDELLAAAPAKTRNLIFNGSFERHCLADVPDSWPMNYWWPMLNYLDGWKVYCDGKEAAVGRESLCFDSTGHKENFTTSLMRLRCIRNGFPADKMPAEAVLSFYGKASEDNIPFYVGVSSFKPEMNRFLLGREWARFSVPLKKASDGGLVVDLFPCSLEPGSDKLGRQFRKEYFSNGIAPRFYPGNLKIWIDGLQLEPGDKLSEYADRDEGQTVATASSGKAIPEMSVNRFEGKTVLDGKFAEPIYGEIKPVDNFNVVDSEGTDTHTAVYQFMDADYLYVATDCREIKGRDFRENAAVIDDSEVYNDDAFELFIMPDQETKNYYHFALNSDNVKYDSTAEYQSTLLRHFHDKGWNSPFQHRTTKLKDGWRAEIAIPLRWLNSWKDGNVVRMNFCRGGFASWAPVANSFHEFERFGYLKGVGTNVARERESITLADFHFEHDPATDAQVLSLTVDNRGAEEVDIALSCSAKLCDEPEAAPVVAERQISLPRGLRRISVSFPGSLYDLHRIEVSLKRKTGAILVEKKEFIRIAAPLSLKTADLVFQGEKVRGVLYKSFVRGDVAIELSLKAFDGSVVDKARMVGSGAFELPVATNKLTPGFYQLNAELKYKDKIRFSTGRKIFVSAAAPSWSRVDAESDNLVVNGKAVFPVFPWAMPGDALGALNGFGCNFTVFRPGDGWRSFTRKELYIKGEGTEYLDAAAKAGISVFVDLTQIIKRATLNPESYSNADFFSAVKAIISEAKDHPAYAGTHMFDEPNWDRSDKYTSGEGLRRLREVIKGEDPRHVVFFIVGGFLQYRCSFELTDIIFYDHYSSAPTNGEARDLKRCHASLEEAAATAAFLHKPMWRALEGDDGFQFMPPTKDEWQTLVYSTLASGLVRGLCLFPGPPGYHSQRDIYMPVFKKAVDELAPFVLSSKREGMAKCVRSVPDIIWGEYSLAGKTIIAAVNIGHESNSMKFADTGASMKIVYKTKEECRLGNGLGGVELTLPGFSTAIMELAPCPDYLETHTKGPSLER